MEKMNKIIKNVLIFLIVFLAINYLMSSCQEKNKDIATQSNNIYFATTKDSYTRVDTVTIEVKNNTKENIIIPNECPNEPFEVYKYENNEWTKRTSTPKLNCETSKAITLKQDQGTKIAYTNWGHALFSEMGRFKIEFKTKINGEEKLLTTNEFTVAKEGVLSQLWRGAFYKPIYNTLIFLAAISPGHDLGLAIIILTLLIRTILLVPSHKAMKSQKRMQEIQPRLEKIKEKYKDDKQKIASETMATWKEAKVNPMGSCLPLLLQFPFLIALFYVIKEGLNPDNVYMLYTTYNNFSVQNINTNFLGILELTKVNIYVLPVIIGGLQFIQMKMSLAKKPVKEKEDSEKKKPEMAMAMNTMTYIMPVMIAVFTASLPAAIGIYWGTSTIYGIIQQVFVNRSKSNSEETQVRVITKN